LYRHRVQNARCTQDAICSAFPACAARLLTVRGSLVANQCPPLPTAAFRNRRMRLALCIHCAGTFLAIAALQTTASGLAAANPRLHLHRVKTTRLRCQLGERTLANYKRKQETVKPNHGLHNHSAAKHADAVAKEEKVGRRRMRWINAPTSHPKQWWLLMSVATTTISCKPNASRVAQIMRTVLIGRPTSIVGRAAGRLGIPMSSMIAILRRRAAVPTSLASRLPMSDLSAGTASIARQEVYATTRFAVRPYNQPFATRLRRGAIAWHQKTSMIHHVLGAVANHVSKEPITCNHASRTASC